MHSKVIRGTIFDGLGSHDVVALVAHLESAVYPRGYTVFTQGQSADHVYIINTGKVKLARVTPNGRMRLIDVLGPGDVLGELAVVDDEPRSFTATTLTQTRAASISQAALREVMAGRPEIARRLLQLLATRLRRTNDLLFEQTHVDVAGRVAKQLLYLAQRFGTVEGTSLRINHELTQAELAHLVGSTRETVNCALADFTQRGCIRVYGKGVVIYDPQWLADRAE